MSDSSDFMSTLKVDLYPDEVYIFTPKGRIIVLPREATPVDFAYAIHSDIGNTCYSAKVNGKAVPLRHTLQNGDTVEIVTKSDQKPSKDWLSFVKTAKARNKIRHLINAEERDKAIEIGQKYLDREARRVGFHLNRAPKEQLQNVAAEYGYGQDGRPVCGARLREVQRAPGFAESSRRRVARSRQPKPRRAGVSSPPCDAMVRDGGVIKVSGVGRIAGLSGQVLQPDPRRGHRRLCEPRQRHRRTFQDLSERAEPAL